MGVAMAIVSRNRHQTFTQKVSVILQCKDEEKLTIQLVQARMWAQGESTFVLSGSSGRSQLPPISPVLGTLHDSVIVALLPQCPHSLGNDEALLIAGLTVGTLISSAVVTGAAAPSAEAKPLVRTDHSWKDILGESTRAFATSSLVLANDSG